jgi:hypothetical protein
MLVPMMMRIVILGVIHMLMTLMMVMVMMKLVLICVLFIILMIVMTKMVIAKGGYYASDDGNADANAAYAICG